MISNPLRPKKSHIAHCTCGNRCGVVARTRVQVPIPVFSDLEIDSFGSRLYSLEHLTVSVLVHSPRRSPSLPLITQVFSI